MLPAPHRMRRREDFAMAVRRGRRAGRPTLAVHLLLPESSTVSGSAMPTTAAPDAASTLPTPQPARVGLVVSKAVGQAVTRTRVKRRLRAVASSRLGRLPDGALLVLRATPAAAGATSAELAADLDRALSRALDRSQ